MKTLKDGPTGAAVSLTNAQRMLWTAEQLSGDAPVYNMAFAFVIHAPIDPTRFETSLRAVVAEADTMRMISEVGVSEPGFRVLSEFAPELKILDLSQEERPVEAFMSWATERTKQPMDLARDPFDSVLVDLGSNKTGWFLRQHHLFADAWGFSVLFDRLAEIYESSEHEADGQGRPLESYVELAQQTMSSSDLPLHETAEPVAMYGWRQGVPTGTSSTRVEIDLGIERTESLESLLQLPGWQSLTRDLGMFRVLSTVLFAYLSRVSGAESITIGAPVHNRPSSRHRRAPGLFTEVFPITLSLGPDETFESIYAHVVAGTDRFLRSSGSGRSSGVVNRNINVVLNYLPMNFGFFGGAKVDSTWIHSGHTEAGHQLRVHATDFDSSGSLKLLFDCNEAVFPAERRDRAIGHFLTLLDAMIQDPETPIDQVVLALAEERSHILATAGADSRLVEGTVLDWFAARAERSPDSVALVDGGRTWTYGELDERSTRAAAGLPTSSTIGICLPRSAEAVIAMLAVLKSGSAYVPMDPSWPTARIEFVIGDAECALVIGYPETAAVPGAEFVSLEDLLAADAPRRGVTGEDMAYVLYTSGSTGEPKGVAVNHSSLANYVSWAGGFYGEGLTFPLFSPLTFDLTVTSIFVPLSTGGSIRVYGQNSGGLDLSVRDVFDEDEVDIVKLTPSHLSLLTEMDLRSSRVAQLVLGGEDLTVPLASRARDSFGGDVELHNEYGPTEATVGCIVHTFSPDADRVGSVPIGRPIQNMTSIVLGDFQEVLPFDVAGHLWVAGTSLSNGYLNRPQLTAEKFRLLPEMGDDLFYDTGDLARMRQDGTIEYLGRQDDQVKVLGARVELGEVEAAVASHPDVISAVATVITRGVRAEAAPTLNCLRCGLPDNHPGAEFDESGICRPCRTFENYRERADTHFFKSMSDLKEVLDRAREVSRSDFDCISLLSGGKDSTYALARIVDMGAKPLAFTLDNGYISDEAKDNIRRVTSALGVDHVFGSTPAMNQIFVDSLERHANVCNGCFKTIYTLSMQLARERGIPLIVTGLSRGQFFETRLTEDLLLEPGITPGEIDARVLEARKAYHQVDDAPRRLLDVEIFETGQIFEDVHFADFYRYCDVGLEEMLAYLDSRLPWVRPSDTGRSTNCLINDVGIYVHKRERGFHNYALPYSWDVRMGHKTRDETLAELDDQIDVQRVQQILEEIGYAEDVTTVGGSSKLVAYYTADSDVSPAELRAHVESVLPSAMVPRQFVPIDEIPLTQHGKADRASLPNPTQVRPEMDTSYVAPRNHLEALIAHTWSEVLGIDEIGVEDNFFDLGGDSIMALQIVSRLRRSGVDVEIRDLFDTLTIAGMSERAELPQQKSFGPTQGPLSLSPMQHWHFETQGDPQHLSQLVRMDVNAPIRLDHLELCLGALTERHPTLRQRFEQVDGVWESELVDVYRPPELNLVDSPPPADPQPGGPFDLTKPPLLRLVAFGSEAGISALDIEAHHLIIDAVSWTVLADDMNYLLGQLAQGKKPSLSGSPSSIHGWLDYLRNRALRVDPSTLPIDGNGPIPQETVGDNGRRVITTRIEAATVQLLKDASGREARIDQMLIAGLALSLPADWVSKGFRLFVEGHGRMVSDTDLSQELGWFTTLTPLLVPAIADENALANGLAQIREGLESRKQLADYGAIRYMHPSPDIRSAVTVDFRREILFNYLGETKTSSSITPLFLAMTPFLDMPASQGPVYGLEVNAWMEAGVLIVEWTVPDTSSAMAAAKTAASALNDRLMSVCRAVRTQTRTAADFPHANLDQRGLAKLSEVLERLGP